MNNPDYKPSAFRRLAQARKARWEREAERKKKRELEVKVKLRTRDLRRANIRLEREIAERERAERELKESEEKYRAIFESFYDIYYRSDMEGRVTAISPSVKVHGGYEPEELIGRKVTDFYPDPQEREKLLKLLFKKGAVNDYEIKMRAKDGRIVDLWVSTHFIYDDDGRPIAVEGVLRNITDRKRAENVLKTSRQKYQAMLESFYDVYYSTNMKGTVTAISPSARAQTGYDPEEILGRPVTDFYPNPSERAELLHKLAETGRVTDYPIHLLSPNGEVLDVLVSTRLVYGPGGNPVSVEGVLRNVTERKRLEEELRERKRRYRALFESAHDAIFLLRGPRFVEWNRRTLEIFQCSSKDLKEGLIYRFLPEKQKDGNASKELMLEKMNSALTGQTQFFTWTQLRFDGQAFEAEISLVRLQTGEESLVQAIVRDLTAIRKKTSGKFRKTIQSLIKTGR